LGSPRGSRDGFGCDVSGSGRRHIRDPGHREHPPAERADESFRVQVGNLATGQAAPVRFGKMGHEGGGGSVVGALRARHALVVITAVVLITGCSSKPQTAVVPPVVPGIQLPVFVRSCAPQPGPPSVVPISVVSRVVIVANVCIGGQGPFPFLVDTGGSTTLVDSSLAARLHLPSLTGLGRFCHSPASGRSPSQLFHVGR
jgi:hypothetical protein